MATTSELSSGGIFLVANTIVIAVCSVVGGPIFGTLIKFVSTYSYAADNPLKPELVQWIPGFFFTLLLILEIVLIVRLAYIVVSKTSYQGEQEW